MGKWKHRLHKLNTEAKTAICEYCGPVSVRKKSGGAYRCYQVVCEEKRRSRIVGPYTPPSRNSPFCEICENELPLCWDHDHETGQFRGWLCKSCNLGLGLFKDRPNVLRNAAQYLEKTKAPV